MSATCCQSWTSIEPVWFEDPELNREEAEVGLDGEAGGQEGGGDHRAEGGAGVSGMYYCYYLV